MTILLVLAVFVLICVIVLIVQNSGYETVEYTTASSRLPEEFDGFRVAQVSDLHSYRRDGLGDTVAGYSPDIIVITGDIIGRHDKEITNAVDAVKSLSKLAPTYYITGNHEAESEIYGELADALRSEGVIILDNSGEEILRGDAAIRICGVRDPAFDNPDRIDGLSRKIASSNAEKAIDGYDGFTLLLAHRPEFIDVYAGQNADLVFSGHAHGGAICLPFGKPIIAPGQGFFPEYTSGVHSVGDTDLVISRGLGDSTVPFRVNCPYELVICTLRSE